MGELNEFVGASVSLELKQRLEQFARQQDLSRAQVIRRALTSYLAKVELQVVRKIHNE